MKKLFKLRAVLSISSCLLFLPSISSCASFFGGDDGFVIEKYDTSTDDDGNILLTFYLTNKELNPIKITIPKGISGDDGVGIESITPNLNQDTGIMELTIKYTDASKNPTVIQIPVIKGEDGTSVNVTCEQDEAGGDLTITFEYSDGTIEGPFTIKKGEDGRGIERIDYKESETVENAFDVFIYYTDGEVVGPLTIKNGKDGAKLVSIDGIESDDKYVFSLLFDDGSVFEVPFTKPKSNEWLNGTGRPSNSLGDNGDFYFDTSNGYIYRKTSDYWQFIFSMSESSEQEIYEVTFNLNGGQWRYVDSENPSQAKENITINVNEGDYINLNSNQFQVIKDGYEFKGWWTDSILTPNSGHFTNLTPVFSDLVLYAQWQL